MCGANCGGIARRCRGSTGCTACTRRHMDCRRSASSLVPASPLLYLTFFNYPRGTQPDETSMDDGLRNCRIADFQDYGVMELRNSGSRQLLNAPAVSDGRRVSDQTHSSGTGDDPGLKRRRDGQQSSVGNALLSSSSGNRNQNRTAGGCRSGRKAGLGRAAEAARVEDWAAGPAEDLRWRAKRIIAEEKICAEVLSAVR